MVEKRDAPNQLSPVESAIRNTVSTLLPAWRYGLQCDPESEEYGEDVGEVEDEEDTEDEEEDEDQND